MSTQTKISTVNVDGVDVFYRSAGSPSAPVVLLLHGFPSSSHQYRNLIPILAESYHVVAPDLPGFGFTVVPDERKYAYTFANLAVTVEALLDSLKIKKYAVYIFDYGAPVAFRLALRRPQSITAIVSQSGNAYDEGLGDFWAPFHNYWKSDSKEDREVLRNAALNFDLTKWQYVTGAPHPEAIPPEAYYLDTALLARPGNQEIQLDLFKDYQTNVVLYPKFHEYLRTSAVPVLAAWGKHDQIFIAPGAKAYEKDVKNLELHYLDAGHFALETHGAEIASLILAFFKKNGI